MPSHPLVAFWRLLANVRGGLLPQVVGGGALTAMLTPNQLGRRNITLACRCELAAKLAEALKALAKENQKLSKGRSKKGSPILADLIDTREQAAKEAGVSHGSLTAFKFLKENASPEVLDELMHNPEVRLPL